MNNVPVMFPLVMVFNFLIGTVIPITYLQLRADDSFSLGEKQFFFGFVTFCYSLGRMIGQHLTSFF